MNHFDVQLESVLGGIFGNNKIVVKMSPSTDESINIVPGYCWGLEGYMHVFGCLPPYPGRALYGAMINLKKLQPWIFKWSWVHVKGHSGPPKEKYSPEHIKYFMDCETPDELVIINQQLGYLDTDPKSIGRSLVKSVMPGMRLPDWDTYTNNYEVIVNVPIKMQRLGIMIDGNQNEEENGLSIDGINQSSEEDIIKIAYKLIRNKSL